MTIDKREIHPTWMQCILEYIGLLWREFLEVSVFHWLSWWPSCRSLCEIICPFTDHISWKVTWIYSPLNVIRWDMNQKRLFFQSGVFSKLKIFPSSPSIDEHLMLCGWFDCWVCTYFTGSIFSLFAATSWKMGEQTEGRAQQPLAPGPPFPVGALKI